MKLNYYLLGKRIKEKRHEWRISQEDLINILDTEYDCGLSRNTLSAIENGNHSRIDLYAVASIADALCVDVGYLIGEQESTYIQEETGLNARSVSYLRKSKGKRISDAINFILQKALSSGKETHLVELIAAYLGYDEKSLQGNDIYLIGEDGHDVKIPVGGGAILNTIMTTLSEYRRLFQIQKQKGKQ